MPFLLINFYAPPLLANVPAYKMITLNVLSREDFYLNVISVGGKSENMS